MIDHVFWHLDRALLGCFAQRDCVLLAVTQRLLHGYCGALKHHTGTDGDERSNKIHKK
jgi:hypothetical protein